MCNGKLESGTFVAHRTFTGQRTDADQEAVMLGWALTFLVVAIIAAIFGFGGVAGVAVEAAKIIFFVAIVLFVLSALFGFFRGRRTL
jgi:uncharacterized membrane protein YtjA (UPF0391 family)